MTFWTIWWVWLSAALVLAILEVLAPGFVFLGFAIGAAIMAALIWGNVLIAALSLPVLLLFFAALSLLAWLILRRAFALPKGQVKYFEDDINDN